MQAIEQVQKQPQISSSDGVTMMSVLLLDLNILTASM